MNARSAQYVLAGVWLFFFIVQAALLALRTVWASDSPDLSDATNEMWKWYLPMVLPTISIILGAIFVTHRSSDSNAFGLFGVIVAIVLSVLYLTSISGLLVMPPSLGTSPKDHVKLLHDSAYWLSGIQVGVGLAIGYVFGRSPAQSNSFWTEAGAEKNAKKGALKDAVSASKGRAGR